MIIMATLSNHYSTFCWDSHF